MTEIGPWLGRLETEIARELGQQVTVVAGGEAPQPGRSQLDVLEVPGARLTLAADQSDLERLLIEGRMIEAGQADGGIVAELWTGILASVSARLGGTMGSITSPASAQEAPGEPCTLHLGNAILRLSLAVDAAKSAPQDSPRLSETVACAIPAPGAGAATPQGRNFDLLLEVELDASVRFGSRELELRELLELGPGDVVELDRHLADPVDLIVGDKIVARGEVVLVNGNFGLRVTEVAEPMRRLESIRCLS
ncbi:MAG: FliM/FliN family flagellar motor switch protein [Acidobacteriaceae bacterium]